MRLGFVFTAIALPGLFVTIVKRLIGRARPFVGGDDVWAYAPFSWQPAYASMPSGHATTAFAALVAIGAICPQARALMWIYAVLIALSRVIVTAHHPSDVIAGAIVGAVGALLVRNWFAARRLGFPGRNATASVRAAAAAQALPAHRQSSCPPPALCLEGAHERRSTANDPGRLGRRSGPERGRQHRARWWPRSRPRSPAARSRSSTSTTARPTAPRPSSIASRRSIPGCGRSATRARAGNRRRCAPALWAARAPVIVTLDGDGQNDPAFLPTLIEALEQGAPRMGLVAGQRVGRKATGFKRFQSRIANAVRGAVLRDGTRDTGCGLKAFPRDVAWRCRISTGCIASCRRWFAARAATIGYVDVVDRPRQHGTSNYGMWDRLWIGILDLFGVWWLIRRRKRVPDISEV